ncbi:alpha/beta hydrolase [Lentilactobacillus sp.]|uniref:alpha/beta hydrolase n=1 Tax=Lentilactobacillus sp. TaxID=2767931 RepID=UPI00345E217B
MKKRGLAVLSGLLLIVGFLSACSMSATQTPKIAGASKATPTLFFHGFGGSYHAENHMAQAAVTAGVTKTVIRADVTNSGKVTLIGNFKPNDRHPIVEVNYLNNHNPNYHTDAKWAKNVVVKLQQRYGVKKFNMVGHSVGNMSIVFYLLDNAGNTKLPKLQKQVDIAGHFNGILGMDDAPNRMKLKADGEPTTINSHYRELLGLRHDQQLKSLKVLNIYGDKNDGTHSDGDVSNASSKSLRYLLPQVKSYQEKRIVGPNAQHSKLHNNPQVDRLLIRFLWGKS